MITNFKSRLGFEPVQYLSNRKTKSSVQIPVQMLEIALRNIMYT